MTYQHCQDVRSVIPNHCAAAHPCAEKDHQVYHGRLSNFTQMVSKLLFIYFK